MKIYTKTGDEGQTGLLGNARVSKTHPGIETCGCLDETNSWIGVAIVHASETTPETVNQCLAKIQNDIFDLGSRVAACESESARTAGFSTGVIKQLEAWIDQFQSGLPVLKAFIMPGGCEMGATLHLARAVCRRSERELVRLIESGVTRNLNQELIYLNRLGDLLFVLARIVNQAAGSPETKWIVSKPD